MKCFIENFLELDIDDLLAVNGGYGSSACNNGGNSSGYGNSSGGSYGSSSSSSKDMSSWEYWIATKDGKDKDGNITRPYDPYSNTQRNSGSYKATSFVPEISGGEESLYGAPTDSRRVTGVIGEKTSLQPSHTGIDIGAVEPGVKGDPIYAVADGSIIRVGTTTNSGSSILEQDLPNTNDTAVYQHAVFTVEAGDTVGKGDVIGYMSDVGTPGQVHLHFEIRDDGQYAGPGGKGELVNPLDYLPNTYEPVN